MSDNAEGLFFSRDALLNRPLFLSRFNDINIYVEDVGKEYEYEEIFERLFESNLNIFSIFPLGGKDAVINAYQTQGIIDVSGKTNIYIVDGDFDNLWDDQKIVAPNLIYLTRYNIESYYCSKEAVLKFMRSFLKCTRSETETKIRFDEWQYYLRNEIGKLFVLFAIVKRRCPGLPNVGLGAGKFLNENGRLIVEEYDRYLGTISQEIGSIEIFIEDIYERIDRQFTGNREEKILSIICGKFQFESLCRFLKNCCNRNINRENFRASLIANFDLQPLDFLKEQMLHLMANGLLGNSSA